MAAALARTPVSPRPEPEPSRPGTMSLLDHLEEFRKRLIRCAIAVAVGMLVAFLFIDRIMTFVFEPARRVLPAGTAMIYTHPGGGFGVYIDVALLAGTVFAAPVIFFQIWRFIAPALYVNEKRFAWPFVVLTSAGAVAGAAFTHYVMFPAMIAFFGTFSGPGLVFMPNIDDVFGLYLKMLAGMAVVFQMPTFAFFLAKMGLISARLLWRNLRYAILVIFVAAAVLTPSADPWNQTVFAAPMIVLYLLSIGIVWIFGPTQAMAEKKS